MPDDSVKNPGVKISHNGADLKTELSLNVQKVQVDHEINVPGMFQVSIAMYDLSVGGWVGVDMLDFQIGDTIDISMGLDAPEKIIAGEVTAIDPRFDESATLVIRGYDKMPRLRYGKYRRSFLEMKDSEIVEQVAGDASLSPQAEATSTVHLYVFQNNISNYKFLLERAKRIGYELLCEGDNLIFRPSGEGEEPAVKLEYGMELAYFSASLKALTQGSTTEVRGWDVANKEEISGKAEKGAASSTMKGQKDGYDYSSLIQDSEVAVVEYPAVDESDAEAMAKAMYNQMLQNFITGEGECVGHNKLLAGVTVELDGLGLSFSGAYYLTKTTHVYDTQGGYRTRFSAKRTGA